MDYHQSTFQMLGQNMFPRAPPSGQPAYMPEKQSQQNKQKFDQLIQLMQDQQQRVNIIYIKVEDYNLSMKQREEQLQQLESQSQQLQKDLVQQDKVRKQHNAILYKNYQPGFNVKSDEPPQDQEPAQSLHSSKYQLYNQGIQPEELDQIQMSQNPRRASMQQTRQDARPQSIQKNPKLLSIQKQIEEQNDYIQQLTALISTKKPNSASQASDSLEALLNEREELKKQQLLNEVKQLKEKLSGLENRQINPYAQQQMMMQPQPGFQMQQYPYQYPMMPPPPNQQTEEDSDDDDLTKQLMMKLMMQQNNESRKKQHKRQRDSREQRRKHKKREPSEEKDSQQDPQDDPQ